MKDFDCTCWKIFKVSVKFVWFKFAFLCRNFSVTFKCWLHWLSRFICGWKVLATSTSVASLVKNIVVESMLLQYAQIYRLPTYSASCQKSFTSEVVEFTALLWNTQMVFIQMPKCYPNECLNTSQLYRVCNQHWQSTLLYHQLFIMFTARIYIYTANKHILLCVNLSKIALNMLSILLKVCIILAVDYKSYMRNAVISK